MIHPIKISVTCRIPTGSECNVTWQVKSATGAYPKSGRNSRFEALTDCYWTVARWKKQCLTEFESRRKMAVFVSRYTMGKYTWKCLVMNSSLGVLSIIVSKYQLFSISISVPSIEPTHQLPINVLQPSKLNLHREAWLLAIYPSLLRFLPPCSKIRIPDSGHGADLLSNRCLAYFVHLYTCTPLPPSTKARVLQKRQTPPCAPLHFCFVTRQIESFGFVFDSSLFFFLPRSCIF